MINLIIESDNEKELLEIKEQFHKALTGSPAYVESEIAICDRDNKSFYLIMGKDNDNDIIKKINTNNIKSGSLEDVK